MALLHNPYIEWLNYYLPISLCTILIFLISACQFFAFENSNEKWTMDSSYTTFTTWIWMSGFSEESPFYFGCTQRVEVEHMETFSHSFFAKAQMWCGLLRSKWLLPHPRKKKKKRLHPPVNILYVPEFFILIANVTVHRPELMKF